MIKNWQLFLEANYTTPNEEDDLNRYFDLTSDDIKDWIQDFLDEHLDLDFEVSVINHKSFIINFFEVDEDTRRIKPTITKEKYPFPEELLQLLKIRLKDYDCYVVPEKTGEGDVYYSNNKNFMSINIDKKYSS